MLTFRRSTPADLPAMARIGAEGKAVLKSRGVSQWQRGPYPSLEDFTRDEQLGIGYVVCDGDEVVAVCAVTFTEDENYNHLTEGEWLKPVHCLYATAHRVAVAEAHRGKNISTFLFDQVARMGAEQGALSVRADTHPDNMAMQAALTRAGFVKCGAMVLLSGHEEGDVRWGYERVL